MNQRARLDVTPGPADRRSILENGVPGFDRADGDLMSTRNQLADVNTVATFSNTARNGQWPALLGPLRTPWQTLQTDTFARLELAHGHRHVVGRINLVNRFVH